MDSHTCKLHTWNLRANSNVKVFDATLMSSELDLLELRFNELDSVVDKFFIVESNTTFTGLPKSTYFADNRQRFSRFEHKIVYKFLPGYPLSDGQDAWDVEANTRNVMTVTLREHVKDYSSDTTTLVLMSDVDEIPSAHTIALLKACDFGRSIHLQLRNFMYSFEWYLGPSSWRASVHTFGPTVQYRHSKTSDYALADSGWHCSFCFRTIAEYVAKMKGYSHSDRIGGNASLLGHDRIQDVICKGKDIFDMLPEAYDYVDMLSQMNLHSQTSGVGLPLFLLENAQAYSFLLPGGCMRES